MAHGIILIIQITLTKSKHSPKSEVKYITAAGPLELTRLCHVMWSVCVSKCTCSNGVMKQSEGEQLNKVKPASMFCKVVMVMTGRAAANSVLCLLGGM